MSITDKESREPLDIVTPAYEQLPEEVLFEMVAAFGNHEGKALLLCAMQPGAQYTHGELHKRFLEIQGPEPAFTGSRRNQGAYCDTFVQTGLVARSDGAVKKYELTDLGNRVGKPLAGLLLGISATTEFSLNDIFSQTARPKGSIDRPPKRMLKIMRTITEANEEIKVTEIAKIHGYTPNTIGEVLSRQDELGLVEYTSRNVQDLVSFKLVDSDRLAGLFPRTAVSKRIFDAFLQQPGISHEIDDLKSVVELDPDEDDAFRGCIQFLRDKGIVVRDHGYAGHEFSSITLTDEQRIFWNDLLKLLDTFKDLSPELQREGNDKARSILDDQRLVKSLVRKAYGSNQRTKEKYIHEDQKKDLVMSVLLPDEYLGIKAIEAAVNAKLMASGKRIGRKVLAGILAEMRKNGETTSRRLKGGSLTYARPIQE